jgi:serine/threonine protein kinase
VSAIPDGAVSHLRTLLARPALPGRYRLEEEIGRGGMGVVWRAHDLVLERDVAVKVLADHLEGEELTKRLRREARILARLEHPGIVSVHDAGTLDDGRAWYAMRLVRGTALRDAAATIPTLGQALRLMMQLAETVGFAHAQGVLHRDLKPGNVMLGPFGEVLVVDWGVAQDRATGDGSTGGAATGDGPTSGGITGHGTVLGTPGYMSPEQAVGLPADARSDVYGLGAILRDLLAARPEPIPAPLRSIRDRALAGDPEARYPDALAFRDDLGRFLDGERVHAHREGAVEILARLGRQHRTAILLVSAYLAMRLVVLLWRGV